MNDLNGSVTAYLMTKGVYEFTLGGYPSKDNNNITYNVFYGVTQKIGKGSFKYDVTGDVINEQPPKKWTKKSRINRKGRSQKFTCGS